MKSLIKPLMVVAFVSFLLGIGLKLQDIEKQVTQRFKKTETLRLLVEDPEWWSPLIEPAKTELNIQLEILNPPRNKWADILELTPSQCHLVAFRSYFLTQFIGSTWLKTWPDELLLLRDQVSADFMRPKNETNAKYFLPLFWNASFWITNDKILAKDQELESFASPEESLLKAQSLKLIPNLENTTDDGKDINWKAVASSAMVALRPTISGKYRQVYLSQHFPFSNDLSVPTELQPLSLVEYGLAPCRVNLDVLPTKRFVDWLLRPDIHTRMLENIKWISTLNLSNSVFAEESPYRASMIRSLPLSRLVQSQLEWPLNAAWFELMQNSVKK